MPKRFTEEQIEWMKEQRRMGHAYSQIANDFIIKYPGEKRPTDSAVFNHTHNEQILIEERLEETAEGESLEDTRELPSRPISEEKKKADIEIMKECVEGKKLEEQLKEGKHHYNDYLRVRAIYENKVLENRMEDWEDFLRFHDVWNEEAGDPYYAGMFTLAREGEEARSQLKSQREKSATEKNEIFRDYREREALLKAENIELKKEGQNKDRVIRGKDLAFNKREKEWEDHVAYLNKTHANEIGRLEQEIRDIRFFETKYEAAMNFAKASDLTKEAYLKGVFNAMAILYDPHVGTKKFRRQIENKLEKAARDRDWNQFMNSLLELAKKVGPHAEEWIKRESAVVAQARDQALQELYGKLRFLGFTGSFQNVKETIDQYRTLPSELKKLKEREQHLKPLVKDLEFKEKVLKDTIPLLQECKEETQNMVVKALQSADKLIEKLRKNKDPKAYAAVKEIKESMGETVAATEKLFSPFQTKQTLSEFLETRKRRRKE